MSLARLRAVTASVGFVVLAASGCSEPTQVAPQAAFSASFFGATCAATVPPGPSIGIGTATATEQATMADGSGDVSVSCKVVPTANGYSAYISVSQGQTSMIFDSDVVQGATTDARSIVLRGPNTSGAMYVPTKGSKCQVTWINGSAGRVWAAFSCLSMETGVSTTPAPCKTEGYVVAENCDES